MRWLIVGFALALGVSTPSLAQSTGSRAIRDGDMTPEQAAKQKLREELFQVSARLEQQRKSIPPEPRTNPGGTLESLKRDENKLQAYLTRVSMLLPLENRRNSLRRSLGIYVGPRPTTAAQIQWKLDQLREARVKAQAVRNEKNAHQASLSKINNELSEINEELRGMGKLENKKAGSVSDFLARTAKPSGGTGGDFLARGSASSSGTGGDFLAGMASKPKAKAGKTAVDKGFQITSRGSLNGVVNSSGRTVIPFREWTVEEYQDGIAKVVKRLKSFRCNQGNIKERLYYINEIGFVDRTGSYLDRPIQVGGSFYTKSQLYLTSSSNPPSGASSDEIRRFYQRQKERERRAKLKEQECRRDGERWLRANL
jgi:hypothetical protein